uniref:PABS domain-containing protein n=1 Tax=Parascaris equorum TaxID=6256 RepID=A0A914RQ70_PAREQ
MFVLLFLLEVHMTLLRSLENLDVRAGRAVSGLGAVEENLMKTDFEYTAAIFIDKFIIDRTQFTIHDEILKLRNGRLVVIFFWQQGMNITVVELEETFYKVAQEYFDLTLDHRQRVIISDVLGQAHFDAIYVDACHPEFRYGAICPVEAFLTKDGAKLLHDALADNGTVAVSILVAPEYIAELYTSSFKEVFEQCALVSYSARMANKHGQRVHFQALICGQRVPEKETLNSEMTAVFEELGFAEFPDETEEGK